MALLEHCFVGPETLFLVVLELNAYPWPPLAEIPKIGTDTPLMPTTDLSSQRSVKAKPLRAMIAGWLVVFLLAGFFAARNLATWPARIDYPGEQSYEGCALVEAARLGQGVPIYAPPSDEGFAGATYGPLYYLVTSRLVSPKQPSYLYPRLLSALAIIGCAAGCGLLAFWLSRSRLAALLSPLLFLSYGVVTFHGVSALSDNVALLLFFSGFLVAYRFQNSAYTLLAAPLMSLGFYYKPQYIAGPLAVTLFLFLQKNYRRGIQFVALLAVSGIILLSLFQWAVFPGQQFYRHFFLYQATLLSWHQFEIGLLVFVLMLAAPLLLGFDFLRTHPDKLIKCYLSCAVLLGIATIAKESAFIQYFYESILLISAILPALLTARIAQRGFPVDVIALLAVALVAGQWYTPPAPSAAAYVENAEVQSLLRRNFPPGARALGFRGGDLIQAGLNTPFADLFQTELLARRRIVPDDHLISRIQSRWFSVIVLDFDLSTERDSRLLSFYLNEPARLAIKQNYEVSATIRTPTPERIWDGDRFYLYVPRVGSGNDKRSENKVSASN